MTLMTAHKTIREHARFSPVQEAVVTILYYYISRFDGVFDLQTESAGEIARLGAVVNNLRRRIEFLEEQGRKERTNMNGV